jgi:hypothetical protein
LKNTIWRDEELEFNFDEEVKKTDFSDETSCKAFVDRVSEHVSFVEKEIKTAFEKRDSEKKGYKVLESKITELQKPKEDPAGAKLLEKELLESATRNRAYRPSEIYLLLRDNFQYDSEKKQFLSKDGLGVEEHVKSFLNSPENDHHLLSDRKGGTGHKFTPLFYRAPKPKPSNEDVEQAEKLNLTLEDFLQIKQIREKKLQKIHRKVIV